MSKHTPPRLLVLTLRLVDLDGAGSVGEELSPGRLSTCHGKQAFTKITYPKGRFSVTSKK